jgi:hypothetical protein
MWRHPKFGTVVLVCGPLAILLSCVVPAQAQAEKPIALEHNPPGDIPDNQVFVTYASPDGFEIKVPEGWARKTGPHMVRFADKYDVITVDEATAADAPTVASLKASEIPHLTQNGRAVVVKTVTATERQAGKAIRIVYLSNSDPNPVTGRQTRLEHERYFYFRDGRQVTLDLAAPVGADNVDQWQLISNSLRWK